MEIPEAHGWFPVTIVGGMVARDSLVAGGSVPVLDRSPGHEPMLVYQRCETAIGTISTEDAGTAFKAYYTMREYSDDPIGAIRRFVPVISDRTAQWWTGLCDRVERGIMTGMIGGGLVGSANGTPMMAKGMLWGVAAGALSEAASYYFEHQYDD